MLDRIVTEDEVLGSHMARAFKEKPIGHFKYFPKTDELIGGINNGRLVVVAGDPGTGKTTLFANWIASAAQAGFMCLVNTLEIAPHSLVIKMLACLSSGDFTVTDITDERNREAVEGLAKDFQKNIAKNIAFLEKPLSAVDLGAIVAQARREFDRPIVLFQDYLQIMPTEDGRNSSDERASIRESVAGLRRIANAHDIPVFAISSINRQNYNKVPGLGALGGCASIEYSADVVLHLSEVKKDCDFIGDEADGIQQVVLTALKNRYGAKGSVQLDFVASHAAFAEHV